MTHEEDETDIYVRDWSSEFIQYMKDRIYMSHYKYGYVSQTYPQLAQAYKCIEERLELYKKTHNTEYLVDIANFAMIEYMRPAFEDAKFVATDSDKSPGLAGGISYRELMELVYEQNDR